MYIFAPYLITSTPLMWIYYSLFCSDIIIKTVNWHYRLSFNSFYIKGRTFQRAEIRFEQASRNNNSAIEIYLTWVAKWNNCINGQLLVNPHSYDLLAVDDVISKPTGSCFVPLHIVGPIFPLIYIESDFAVISNYWSHNWHYQNICVWKVE